MDVGRIIKSLSLRQITAIIGKVISSPVLFYSFVKATKKCISICDKRFAGAHHKNNKTNAYRHALWNMSIAFECIKLGKDISIALLWAKEITDWHEQAFVNKAVETHMDLHNNKKGRQWFKQMHKDDPTGVNYDTMDQFLMEKFKYAKKLNKDSFQEHAFEENLVYIEEL
jgi:hypothetical protein